MNPYKKMYVVTAEQFKRLKREDSDDNVTCPTCGREFENANILAHHLKSHVDGFKCNICGEVFTEQRLLSQHLKEHDRQDKQPFELTHEWATLNE
jgi:uncharacterized C2H2 Zn-finger protein